MLPVDIPAFVPDFKTVAVAGTPPNSSTLTAALVALLKFTVTALDPALMPAEYQSSILPVLPARLAANE